MHRTPTNGSVVRSGTAFGDTAESPPSPTTEDPSLSILWQRDPIIVLERLRDRVCAATELIAEVYIQARHLPAGASLGEIDTSQRNALWRTTKDAQAIWFGTPAARYLQRADGPVRLDCKGDRPVQRVMGTCFHDLALGGSAGTLSWMDRGGTAARYVQCWNRWTNPRADIPQRLMNLRVEVQCECLQAMDRLRAEGRHTPADLAQTSHPVHPSVMPDMPATWPELLSARNIADYLEQEVDRVEVVLRRLAEKHPDCRRLTDNPRRNECRYLYHTRTVWPALCAAMQRWNFHSNRSEPSVK